MLWLVARFLVGIGSFGGLAYWAKRHIGGPKGPGKPNGLRVVSRVGVAKGATVVRVATGDDKDLLLGCTPQGITSLAELPASTEVVPVGDGLTLEEGALARLRSAWSGTRRRDLVALRPERSFASTLRAAVRGRAGSP